MLRVSRLAAFVVLLALPATAAAQAPLIGGLGNGPGGYGPQGTCLGPNDDGSSASIDIRSAFPMGLNFFGTVHTSMFVNTNGNISFSRALSQFTPNAFPVASQPMIAPYWADVDIRGTNCSSNGVGVGNTATTARCSNPTNNLVTWFLEPGRIIVTWRQVGYFNCQDDKKHSIQLILTAAPAATSCTAGGGDSTNFDVEFRYNGNNGSCDLNRVWETGSASGGTGGYGGTPAQAGFDAGNSMNFVEIMGSRMANIGRRLCIGTNVPGDETASCPNGNCNGIWRFKVRGGTVMCPDAGMMCSTGMMGVCGQGRTQCVGRDRPCVQEVQPSAERCDALDNDCNGMTDEGDTLCPRNQICVQGSCVDACFEGGCGVGQTCVNSVCVDDGCAGMTCPAGQRCSAGMCIGACEGVTCPAGRVCRSARCVDPCAGVTCDAMQQCVDGICQCSCTSDSACTGGRVCDTASGRCVAAACQGSMCGAGTVCVDGACVDACAGAMCPRGETCVAGDCVVVEEPDAGPPAARVDSGTGGPPIGSGSDGSVNSRVDAGPGRIGPGVRSGGCCHVNGAQPIDPRVLIAMVALVGLVVRRRRIKR